MPSLCPFPRHLYAEHKEAKRIISQVSSSLSDTAAEAEAKRRALDQATLKEKSLVEAVTQMRVERDEHKTALDKATQDAAEMLDGYSGALTAQLGDVAALLASSQSGLVSGLPHEEYGCYYRAPQ